MEYPTLRLVFDRKKVASKIRKGLVQIEIMSERKRKWISTHIRLHSDEWSATRMVCKRLDANVLNSNLRTQLEEIQDWINELRRKKESFDFYKLELFLKGRDSSTNFLEYLEQRIHTRVDIKEMTKKTHRSLLASLKAFNRIDSVSDLTKGNILAYDEWLRKKNYAQPTIHAYHRILKTYINDAIRREIISENPYTSIKIERGKSKQRRYLSEQELQQIIEADMPTECLQKVRDIFVFQCFTGLAYVDLMSFDFSKVVERNGQYVIHDVRQKSGENFYLVLLSPAIEILKRYGFKLPLISNQKYNSNLKNVARNAKLERNLTSHMVRHTFAVYCLNNGVPIEILAKMMGHSDIKTTQIYATIVNKTVEAAFGMLENRLRTNSTDSSKSNGTTQGDQ